MAPDDVELVRRGYAAAVAGDVDRLTELFHPDLRWHGARDDDGGCQNRDEALVFIRRALEAGVTVELIDARQAGDHVVATLQRAAGPDGGERPEPHGELVTVRDGRIVEMVFYESPDEARAAAAPTGSSG